jgi:hypothetical protein
MFNQIDLTPAYGRDYKSKAAVLLDWYKGLDFKSSYGYINIDTKNDLKAKGILEVNFRYNKQSKKLVVKL